MPDKTKEELCQERARVLKEYNLAKARLEALGTELADLSFRIYYFNGVPRECRSGWENPVLTEKPKPARKEIPVPDFDLLD